MSSTSSPQPPISSPLLIALTGGIASGKSVVAELFAERGVPVLDTDQIARDVVEPGSPALEQLVQAFGADILDASGRLDRALMRERVAVDPLTPPDRRRSTSLRALVILLARPPAAADGADDASRLDDRHRADGRLLPRRRLDRGTHR